MVRRWVGTRDELRALICDRRDELDLAHTTIDAIAGVPDGYTSKVLAPKPVRNFGAESLSAILGALALGIARVEIVEDPEAAARVSGRWVQRRKRPTRGRDAFLCVAVEAGAANVGAAQHSFEFVYRKTEQAPDDDRQTTHDDDHDAR